MNLDKKISELTLRELYAVFGTIRERQYQYGIIGIAKIFGCSRSTAQKIKNSGIIDDAIYQNGNIIVVDVTMALQLLRENGKDNQISKKYETGF